MDVKEAPASSPRCETAICTCVHLKRKENPTLRAQVPGREDSSRGSRKTGLGAGDEPRWAPRGARHPPGHLQMGQGQKAVLLSPASAGVLGRAPRQEFRPWGRRDTGSSPLLPPSLYTAPAAAPDGLQQAQALPLQGSDPPGPEQDGETRDCLWNEGGGEGSQISNHPLAPRQSPEPHSGREDSRGVACLPEGTPR